MNIGDVAAISGLTPKTIRYYESRGLLQPMRSTNGYRSYRASDARRLRLLAEARKLGLSLSDCETLLEAVETNETKPGTLSQLLRAHLDTLEQEARAIETKRLAVIELLNFAPTGSDDDEPLLRVLTEHAEDGIRLSDAS